MSRVEPLSPEQDSYDSIKLMSQEIIEEKEAIIEQIYKQLKDSLATIDILTNQILAFKQSPSHQLNFQSLQDSGFVRNNQQRSFIILDITHLLQNKRQTIIVDTDAHIVNELPSDNLQNKFEAIQVGYRGALQQCEVFLKALTEKEQTQLLLQKQIAKIKEESITQKAKISQLEQELQMLEIEIDQYKQQKGLETKGLEKERDQISTQLLKIKEEQLQKNKVYELIKDENERLKAQLNQLRKETTKHHSNQIKIIKQQSTNRAAALPLTQLHLNKNDSEFEEIAVNGKTNEQIKINVPSITNIEDTPKFKQQSSDNLSKPPELTLSADIIDEAVVQNQKIETKNQLSPTKLDNDNLNNFHDTFPQAKTQQKHEGVSNHHLPPLNHVPVLQKGHGKKVRKVIRLNF